VEYLLIHCPLHEKHGGFELSDGSWDRVTRCPGLAGTVPEWKEMSRVPARSIPGQWNVPEWSFLELNSPILLLYLKKLEIKNISATK